MLCFIISIEKYNFFFKFKIVVQNQQPAFSKSIITEGKKWRWKFNNCLFAWYGTVWQGFLEPQNHRVKLKSTFHGESLKCWMVSKFLLGEIEIWELSLALQISANQQALQTVSGTVKKRKKLLWKSNNHGYEITVWALL